MVKKAHYIYILAPNKMLYEFPIDMYYCMKSFKKFHEDWEIKLHVSKKFLDCFKEDKYFKLIKAVINPTINIIEDNFDCICGVKGSIPNLTDIIRLKVIYEEGGIYVDNDCIFTKRLPIKDDDEYYFQLETSGPERILLGYFGAKPKDEIVLKILNNYKSVRSYFKNSNESIIYLEHSAFFSYHILEKYGKLNHGKYNIFVKTIKDFIQEKNKDIYYSFHISTSSKTNSKIYFDIIEKYENGLPATEEIEHIIYNAIS